MRYLSANELSDIESKVKMGIIVMNDLLWSHRILSCLSLPHYFILTHLDNSCYFQDRTPDYSWYKTLGTRVNFSVMPIAHRAVVELNIFVSKASVERLNYIFYIYTNL